MHLSNTFRGKCVAAVGSMTAAIKTQRALALHGIEGEVVALDPHQTRRGCAYGVEFYADVERAVRNVLREAGISVSQYIHEE